MHKFNKSSCLIFVFFVFAAYSQTVRFIPDTAAMHQYWHITDKTSLYVGASFYYMDPNDSIVVWREASESQNTGRLYFMVPGYPDSALFLFTNRDTGARVNVTKMLKNPIPAGTEIFFMYQIEGNQINNKRYTGQNRYKKDPIQSIYSGASFVSRECGSGNRAYGHRWSVAGRITDSLGAYTDTIVFGFEDEIWHPPSNDSLVAADFDFNDVIFKTTGLDLNVEPFPDSIVLVTKTDSVNAGDSVIFTAQVWADSAGIKIKSHSFDSLLTWKMSGAGIHNDTLMGSYNGSDSSAVFLPRTAYQQFPICASLISPVTKETLSVCKNITVLPGKPEQLSIELTADTSNRHFSFNQPMKIKPSVNIASNMKTNSVYAILRDRYGNFSDFSKGTVWDTLSPSVVGIKNGNVNKGEGIVEKKKSGNSFVYAFEAYNGDTLRDTVLVNVASIGYDSLQIRVISGGTAGFRASLTMTTDDCDSLIAFGRRVDDSTKWEPVSVNWFSTNPWVVDVDSETAQTGIKFLPKDTGTAIVKIKYWDDSTTLPVHVKPGAPASVRLYTDKNTPFGNDTFALAGDTLSINAWVLDKHGIKTSISKKDTIKWTLVEKVPEDTINSSGTLSDSTGSNTKLIPLRARRVVKVFGAMGSLGDSLEITIKPGNPYQVFIESDTVLQRSMYAPEKIDTVEIPDNRIDATVYAIVRDRMGNYVKPLGQGTWSSGDTIVNIQAGSEPCIGVIRKNLQVEEGVCSISIKSDNLKGDIAYVKLLPYHYTALRIASKDSIQIDSLVISTNIDTILRVQALRSDTAIWKDVQGDWSITEGLLLSGESPHNSQLFLISPIKPGKGYLSVSLGTLRDSISARFTRGAPVRAEFTIITQPEKLIAGDTIKAIVRIYNTDGLVPGIYNFTSDSSTGASAYQDIIGFKKGKFFPLVFSRGKSSRINIFPADSQRIPQKFVEGIDTISILLYYAPYNVDSLHRLTVHLGTISAATPSFRIKPSDLNSLTISHTHACCPDTLVLRYPDDQALLYTIGFDRFGNMRGGEACDWITTGTLHKFESNKNVSRIAYRVDPGMVLLEESGFAAATSSTNKEIHDSLYIKIIGPLAVPLSAITSDRNGNGLIDLIKIRFDKPVFINSKQLKSYFTIQYNSVTFKVDSVSVLSDSIDLYIYLKETENSRLQTNWKPTVMLENSDFLLGKAVEYFSIESIDGIGPVIASVKREIMGSDRRNDLVTVEFSEDVYGPDGNRCSLMEFPEALFSTWYGNSNGTFSKINLLEGIDHFNTPFSPNQLYFNTSNGIELTSQHYFNLRTDSKAYIIRDADGNSPSDNNRKVKVDVYGDTEKKLVVIPNPCRPSPNHEKPGVFHLQNNPAAFNWVLNDKGGTAITFQIVLPEKGGSIGGRITIYDLVGNIVAADPLVDYKWMNLTNKDKVVSNETKWNILPKDWTADGTVYNYTVYWNGFTINGLKAAPGVYKVILKMFTKSGGKENVTFYKGTIGIKK